MGVKKILSGLFGGSPSGREALVETRVDEEGEQRDRSERPREVNLEDVDYMPLPPSPKTWEVDGRQEFHRDYGDPAVKPVIEAGWRKQHTKVVKLGGGLSPAQRQGAAGETIAKAFRHLVSQRRKAGQPAAAAKRFREMMDVVPDRVEDRDRRSFNRILDEMDKKGIAHGYSRFRLQPASALPRFEVSAGSGWAVVSDEKLPDDDKPDPALRVAGFVADGVLLFDRSGRSATAAGGPAALRKLGRRGEPVGARPLSHDIYRIGRSPSSPGCAIFDSRGVLHLYDAGLEPIVGVDLQSDPRVVEHFRAIATDYWGEFKSQVRAVGVSPCGERYLFTLADEAWCCTLDGRTCWGLQMPLNEGFERVVGRSGSYGVASEVDAALRTLGLSLPVRPADIKGRFRERALECHPDRNPDDPNAVRRMQELNAAFAILTGVDAETLSFEDEETDKTYFRRKAGSIVAGGGGVRIDFVLGGGYAQDWVYQAAFAADGGAYLATYSGKVIQVSPDGEPQRVYDLGSIPAEIADTGRFLYFLTPTRLYVLEAGTILTNVLDTYEQGQLLVAESGFGLLAEKCLQWFSPDGSKRGELTTKDPIRLIYGSDDGAVVETRRHRAVVSGLDLT